MSEDAVWRDERLKQRVTFDQVAKTYDTARPAYPDAVYADVAAFAGLKAGERILEVGCGSGQATAGFARLGLPLLALDPGGELLAIARRNLAEAGHVGFVETTFEAWPPEPGAFRLVASAQAIHWVAPEIRFAKAAAALSPGGTLAVFGNVPKAVPEAVRSAIFGVYLAVAPELLGNTAPETWYLPSGPVAGLIAETPAFGPVEHRAYAWSIPQTAQSYRALMSTKSYHQALPEPKRTALLDGIEAAIAKVSDGFEFDYETHLYLAKAG
ncbi:class I SAM-dependent methyltransferase [Phenylobacterium aquaticum]|uniref:class I SAM-dependent methyltransferase n=1 Tax=Phenylobacterium aquaticum TaxID=1763816 RepID=UPI001F5C6DE8|nr:class I SAM-dependent methyltransferase [Phenylobacterium aquaticum]MCI3134999.1 class I SAM-dependent methyltransferase [Phenylobacterium aquaticum]